MDRICNNCGVAYQHYGQKTCLCRSCKREYDREYHKARSIEKKSHKYITQKIRRRAIVQSVVDYLKLHPCEECGESRIPCLQFDHLDQSNKYSPVSNLIKNAYSLIKIMEEIEKCRVLCANCHAIHTAKQCNWYVGIEF